MAAVLKSRLLLKADELLSCDYGGCIVRCGNRTLRAHKIIDGYTICTKCIPEYVRERDNRNQRKLF